MPNPPTESKKPKFFGYALLAGAVGGAMPSIVNLSFSNQSIGNIAGALLGTSVFMFFGALVVFFYQEENMKTALAIGASLPGILQGLTKSNSTLSAEFSLTTPMYAQQPASSTERITIIVDAEDTNDSKEITANRLKSKDLWFSTPAISPLRYHHGMTKDTIFIDLPTGTSEVRLTPGGGYDKENALILDNATLQKKVIHVKFSDNGFWQSFWQSAGNDHVPSYKIMLSDKK
ncbi:MAG: hypothetical protein IPM69_00285 [Ignavibacteria bacterium]|nr:hypothetical protein [Ignavibacteria bacterium]